MIVLFVLLLSIFANILQAEIRLPSLISDNMVLQKEKKTKIWGWADPGEKLFLKCSWKDTIYECQSDKHGCWYVEIELSDDKGPHSIVVYNERQSINVGNILFGDVWLSAGQSNMEFRLIDSEKGLEAVENAACSQIRLFMVQHEVASEPQKNCRGKWVVCSPETVYDFSAVSCYFGKRLWEAQDVAVGLIDSSWGGTKIESWSSYECLEKSGTNPDNQDLKVECLHDAISGYETRQKKWLDDSGLTPFMNPSNEEIKFSSQEYDDKEWNKVVLPNLFENVIYEPEADGVVWLRKKVYIPESWCGSDICINLGAVDDSDITYFNGMKIGELACDKWESWSSYRRYRVPGDLVNKGENLIAIRVMDVYGNGGFKGKCASMTLSTQDYSCHIPISGSWKFKVKKVFDKNKLVKPDVYRGEYVKSSLFNAMISPLTNYNIRGVLWYQGESNVRSNSAQYQTLFTNLISDWRLKWSFDDMPFYYVQIAPYCYNDNNSAAILREAQRQCSFIDNVGMAVTADIGNWEDIHPVNKQDVADRLYRLAAKYTYNDKRILSNGPTVEKISFETNSLKIFFDNIGSALFLKKSDKVNFEISGSEKDFMPIVPIIEDNVLVVDTCGLKHPISLRYLWADNSEAVLFNSDFLPASPFIISEESN